MTDVTNNPFAAMIADITAKAKDKVQKLNDLGNRIKSATGDKSQINDLIESTTDEQIIAQREKIAAAKAKIAEAEKVLIEWAQDQLSDPDFNLEEAQREFKELRTHTKTFLLQAEGTLRTMEVPEEDISELSELVAEVKGSKTTSTGGDSPEYLAKVRSWASDNGYEVAARGRISQDIKDAYKAAHGE